MGTIDGVDGLGGIHHSVSRVDLGLGLGRGDGLVCLWINTTASS